MTQSRNIADQNPHGVYREFTEIILPMMFDCAGRQTRFAFRHDLHAAYGDRSSFDIAVMAQPHKGSLQASRADEQAVGQTLRLRIFTRRFFIGEGPGTEVVFQQFEHPNDSVIYGLNFEARMPRDEAVEQRRWKLDRLHWRRRRFREMMRSYW